MTLDPTQAIRDLASDSNMKRTKVSRIRELLPEIEHAQMQGVRLDMIVAALTGAGFPGMDIKSLQNLMYQARHSKGGKHERQSIAHTDKPNNKGDLVSEVKPANTGNGGIDADIIMNAASKAVRGKRSSDLTLALLRGNKTSITSN
jgi:hypothetical protein